MMHSYSYTQNKYTCQAYRYRTRGSHPGRGGSVSDPQSSEERDVIFLVGRCGKFVISLACSRGPSHTTVPERGALSVRCASSHLHMPLIGAHLPRVLTLCAIVPFALFEIISVYTSPITISHLRYALFTRETAPAARARTGFPCRHARYAESRRETSSPARLHSRRVAGLRVALAGRTGHLS